MASRWDVVAGRALVLGGSPAALPAAALISFFKKNTQHGVIWRCPMMEMSGSTLPVASGQTSSRLSCAGVAGAGWQPLTRPRALPVPGCGADTVKAPVGLRSRAARHATSGAKLAESGCESGRAGSAASLGAAASRGTGGSASPLLPDAFSQGRRGNGVGTGTCCLCLRLSRLHCTGTASRNLQSLQLCWQLGLFLFFFFCLLTAHLCWNTGAR